MIQLSPDSTGKKVDTEELTVGLNSVHRERMQIAGDSATDIAPVTAADGLTVNLGTNNDVTVAGVSTLVEQQAQSVLLGTIDADTSILAGAVAGTEVQVDVVSLPNEGQQTMLNSISVAVASDQSAVPISAASLPLPTGAATAAAQLPDGHAVTVDNAAGAAAVNVQDGGNSLTVDGSVSITGAVDTELPAAAALADATANPTTPLIGAALETFNGTTWDRARGDTTNGLDVDVTRLPSLVAGTANIGDVDVLTIPAPLSTTGGGTEATALRVTVATDSTGVVSVDDNGSSLTVDGTVTANQGTAGTAWEVVGDVAADIAVPANPLTVGGRASTAVPTAVSADGDSVYNWLNRNGLQVVSSIPGAGLNADPYTLLSVGAQYTTTQTSAVLLAGGASERIVVTSIQIQAGGTTAGTLQVYFGTGAFARGTNSAIFDGEFAPSATLKPGFVSSPPSGYRSPTLGHDVLVTTSAAINPLTITIWYYLLGV